ncbi:nucleoporin [Amylostereum chailletii]|nr:nucleoporin [Amylostereum chailletii]
MSFTTPLRSYSGIHQPSSSVFSVRHDLPPPKAPPTLDLSALQTASRVLQEHLAKDAQSVPDLGDMLTLRRLAHINILTTRPLIPSLLAGGQSSALYSVFPDDYRVPFQKRRLIGIPEGLFQFYNTTDVVSHMGLISELDRVWVAIDHKLLLWDYVEGQDLSSFTDQPDVITLVRVVKPKPGVFVEEINHLLVLCTPLTVLLLGVCASQVQGPNGRMRKDIKLYATDMSVACDVEMTDVVGTEDGRIFMSGAQDGHVYEFHYQEKEGWFGKRVQLINHSIGGVQSFFPRLSTHLDRIISLVPDYSRGIFYTLTSSNIISVYQPTANKSLHLLQNMSNLYKLAQEKAPGSPALTPKSFQIIALHVVTTEESRTGVQLMAITENGTRLYFAASAQAFSYYSAGGSEPRGHRPLQLIHVRLLPPNLLHPDEQSSPYHARSTSYPPSNQPAPPPTSRSYPLTSLENTVYYDGLTIAAQPGDTEGTDFILCMSPDLTRIGTFAQLPHQTQVAYGTSSTGPQRPPLTERAAILTIPGRTWGMAPVPRSSSAPLAGPAPAPIATHELAYQFLEPPRQFMILTNVGLTILAKRRAMDWLKDVIEEVQAEGNAQPIIEFRDSFGRDQTCAMLLALASGNTFLDLGEQSTYGTLTTLAPEVANVAKQAFYDCGERPMWAERMTYGTAGEASGTALFSGRREGLALYFARLIRPIWKSKLTTLGPHGLYVSNIPEDLLFMVQKNLFALKDLLDKNPHLFHSATGDYTGARAAPASDQEAWKAEQNSVTQLQTLLTRVIEGASFFLLLVDHRLGELIAQTDPDTQKLFTSLTFEELATGENGVIASRALVNVVIDQQIGQQIGVDTISDVLQSRCGSFCSTDDVMLYKAKENTRRAVECRNPTERQNYLSESLRLFIKGARILDFDKLREVIGDYQQLNFAKGAVELSLHCAEATDTDHQGQEYWHSGPDPSNPNADPRQEFWERRAKCYDLVLDSLETFEKKAAQPGDDAELARAHAYELAFASTDEMFHSRLYEWLIARGLADELLEMRPAYLEAFLQRDPPAVEKYQLLWQFYVKDGQPLKAAEVLGTLAESTQFPVSLPQRIEYLTLAVGNAKSHPISAGGRHESAIAFLTELEEKLEVSQVQLEIFNTLAPRVHLEPADEELKERFALLERGLYNVSELYQVYAEPYDLPTVKLLILHVSQHKDERLVKDIWARIFDELTQGVPPAEGMDKIQGKIVPLGQRFYPSESAFPFRHIARLLVNLQLANANLAPPGWAGRILVQCGVPYGEIWDVLHQMYESQVPPFNAQAAVQTLSSAICVLLQDWLEAAKRSSSEFFPVDRIDSAVEVYLRELDTGAGRKTTQEGYERIRRELRRNW